MKMSEGGREREREKIDLRKREVLEEKKNSIIIIFFK